ncbi:flagellin C-terminal helical region [Cohaesibacter marisflavi]|uniref:Flagellin n=1 Tax=Cohaesibacter marisflavi TaxID=655353 RepID=A0A1I5J1J6_9HYPH|nr:flagellin [Cohaesibacter marisflavi]SFO66241.1 flagellin C-terminal helical region [Cohaesibacter marisflavi]
MSDITLSAGVRANLLSLQNTADMMQTTQGRLSTGKKVNSALDNPTNFFTSANLNSRANELNNLMDSIGNATKVLEAADNGISAITDLVESAQSTVNQALAANASNSGTNIQGTAGINTSGASESTAKERAEGIALNSANIGFAAGTNFTVESKSESGVTKTFDLIEHFSNTGESLTDGDLDTAGSQAYTVKDLVDDINASGVATAKITEDGRLDISANGNSELTLTVSHDDGAAASAGAQDTSVWAGLGFGTFADIDPGSDGATDPGDTDATFTGAASGTDDVLTIKNYAGTQDASNTELVEQFNDIMDQIDELARDSSFNGINLINGTGSDLTVAFNEKRDETKSELTIESADLSSSGLGLADATSLNTEDSNNQLDALSEALSTLRTQASSFGSQLNTVTIREEFTKDMINTLQTGADDLVLADTNEEGANMLALQTRQSLSTTALSLASQADQAVLSFLR